jgi:hypothetical protein
MIPGWSQLQLGLVAGLALLLVIVGGVASCEHNRARAEHQQRLSVEMQLAAAIDANASNQVTIGAQQRALEEWRSLGVTPEEAAIAVASMSEIRGLVAKLREAIEKAKEVDRAKPDCAALLGASIERMCPGIAAGLRRAQDSHKDAAGGSARPSREAAPSRAHEGLRTALPVPGD